jgi:predicted HTH transcriptional regulator
LEEPKLKDLFDLSKFDSYKEDNRCEVKKAAGGLPTALWDTYSSFANSNGGVIILGVGERQDGSWYTTGLKNVGKLKKNFWNTIHDRKKVSINLLSEKNVESYEVGEDVILVIYVPRAKREEKPVFINNDLFGGTYRRDWEGDYHCTKSEIRAMIRDATEETSDMKIVEQFDLSVINLESLHGYRNYHKSYRPEHVFHRLSDE